jgi:hypothetical protein
MEFELEAVPPPSALPFALIFNNAHGLTLFECAAARSLSPTSA